MNTSFARSRAIAVLTLIAAALSLAGCTNKSNPAAQAAPAAVATASGQAPSAAAQSAEQPPAPETPLTLPRGSRLEVRLGETIDVKHVSSGDRFTGSLVAPVVVGNTVAVPSGSAATGEVLVAHRRGMFKGRSMIALTLTQFGGQRHSVPHRYQ
jgi:hypothetical protein